MSESDQSTIEVYEIGFIELLAQYAYLSGLCGMSQETVSALVVLMIQTNLAYNVDKQTMQDYMEKINTEIKEINNLALIDGQTEEINQT